MKNMTSAKIQDGRLFKTVFSIMPEAD